ncbi:AAA family ATPase [Flavobacterium sp. LT1R49]|uniref:AAA family ATPase n=1 Tax=Flavobacterium arabinosi TaxID=3398737 RepID=UPI003A896989
MLIQFSVRNFRTFKEKATLNLLASNYDKDTRKEDNITEDNKFNLNILKSAVVYGANASGKSKFIDALMFMQQFVTKSSKDSQKGEPISVEPYRLNSETENSPTEFEVIFTFRNIMYRYGFEVDKKQVVSEWLFHKTKAKEVELFYRDFQDFETHPRSFTKSKTIIKEGLVRNNALLLSVSSQFNEETATLVLTWFQELNIISGLQESGFKNNTIAKIKDKNEKVKVLKLLKAADFGIQDINYEEFNINGLSEEVKKKFQELKESVKHIDPEAFSDVSTLHTKFDSDQKKIGEVKFSVQRDESNGTMKFLYLTGTLIDVLETGGILFADELDSKLHPNLVCKIVSLFNSKELNPKNAQIIFNTHDTNLLSSGLFRRDQIWLIEKNKFGEAQLYSLADFKSDKVRKTEAFEENYINGKYGAIPFLGFFDNLTYSNSLRKDENEK